MCVASCSHRCFCVPKENCNKIKNEIKKNIPVARDVLRLKPLLLLLLLLPCCRFDMLRWPRVVVVMVVMVVVVEVVKVTVVAETKNK